MVDVCVIGSGAGGLTTAVELAKKGLKVIVLEKGPWLKTKDFSKDEFVVTRRDLYRPSLQDEFHEIAKRNKEGNWVSTTTKKTGKDHWNGSAVGGSSNFMSGYFHRLKPSDFKLLSKYGSVKGANITDWPISYADLEPYYTRVEQELGVSGKVENHPFLEPRSTEDFPYPPLATNHVSSLIDKACYELDISIFNTPRAILSAPKEDRKPCYYSGYCGSFGCSSDAKGSSRAAFLDKGLKTGHLEIIPFAKVFHLECDESKKITTAFYHSPDGDKSISAEIFVVAAQATETARLLLLSKQENAPDGISNFHNQVGKNLIYSGGGIGSGTFYYNKMDASVADKIKVPGLFVNRASQHRYEAELDGKLVKGGTVDFLWSHSNPVAKVIRTKWNGSKLLHGSALKKQLLAEFTTKRTLNFEVFVDWLPHDDCYVTLSNKYKDKWGDPVGRIHTENHPHDEKIGTLVGNQAKAILNTMGADDVSFYASTEPSVNLQAGGCRFGNNVKTSVLNENCQSHVHENLFIADGSFMPTGGSVTYTFTIYANALRVADKIAEYKQLLD